MRGPIMMMLFDAILAYVCRYVEVELFSQASAVIREAKKTGASNRPWMQRLKDMLSQCVGQSYVGCVF